MSNSSSDSIEATEHTALMDGHIAEARPDRETAERIARKRQSKTESQRSYGVCTPCHDPYFNVQVCNYSK